MRPRVLAYAVLLALAGLSAVPRPAAATLSPDEQKREVERRVQAVVPPPPAAFERRRRCRRTRFGRISATS